MREPSCSKENTVLNRYEEILAEIFLPVIYILVLIHLAAETSGTAFRIQTAYTRPILLGVTAFLTIVPLVHLLSALPANIKTVRIHNWILLGGIAAAHLITLSAHAAGKVLTYRLTDYVFYDMLLVGVYFLLTRKREHFLKGMLVLSIMLWLSAWCRNAAGFGICRDT